MRVHILKAIDDLMTVRLEAMFAMGAFPEVRFQRSSYGYSYSLFEYGDTYRAMARVLDTRMKEKELDPVMGVFTRKHSEKVLAQVKEILDEVCEADIIGERKAETAERLFGANYG